MCDLDPIAAVEAVEKYEQSKKALDAVVWVSQGPKRIMRIIGFDDPDQIVEGEIVDDALVHHGADVDRNIDHHVRGDGEVPPAGRSKPPQHG